MARREFLKLERESWGLQRIGTSTRSQPAHKTVLVVRSGKLQGSQIPWKLDLSGAGDIGGPEVLSLDALFSLFESGRGQR